MLENLVHRTGLRPAGRSATSGAPSGPSSNTVQTGVRSRSFARRWRLLNALRRKPRASIRVACELAASGDAAAVYTAGHTGAALLAAHGAFGLLPHVERPAARKANVVACTRFDVVSHLAREAGEVSGLQRRDRQLVPDSETGTAQDNP